MASELQSAGQPIKIWIGDNLHELIIRTRYAPCSVVDKQGNERDMNGQDLGELTLKTIGLWLAVYKAIESKEYNINRATPERELGINRSNLEPLVTVFNKTWDGLSVTVNSGDDGKGAIQAVLAIDYALESVREKLPQLFQVPQKSSVPASPKNEPPDLDEFIKDDPYQQSKQESQATDFNKLHLFRMFKRIAPTVIQLQEFVQGGGERYQKSAIEATQNWHKKAVQGYDEGALVYYPITGAIALKEGRFGLQASIVTAKGTVYIDATNRNGEETIDWKTFKEDVHTNWYQLEENGYYEANGCILVLKMSAASDDVQWKNYYHIYQAYNEIVIDPRQDPRE